MGELRQVRDELRDFLDDPSRKIKPEKGGRVMGAGTREADRLAEQQNEGPFLVLFDVGGGVGAGMFMSPTLVDTLEDVQAHVENAEKASDGNVTVRSIKLSKVLVASELVEAMKNIAEQVDYCCTTDPAARLFDEGAAYRSLKARVGGLQAIVRGVRPILEAAGEKV